MLAALKLLIDAIQRRIAPARITPAKKKRRLPPPVIGSPGGPCIGVLTAEQIEEVAFGPIPPIHRRGPV